MKPLDEDALILGEARGLVRALHNITESDNLICRLEARLAVVSAELREKRAQIANEKEMLAATRFIGDALGDRVQSLEAQVQRGLERVSYYENMRTFPRGRALEEIRAALTETIPEVKP